MKCFTARAHVFVVDTSDRVLRFSVPILVLQHMRQ